MTPEEKAEWINGQIQTALNSSDEDEADRAAVNAFRGMRRLGLTVECLVPNGEGYEHEMDDDGLPAVVIMPFGKYRGKTLSWIAGNDADYMEWLKNDADIRSERLRKALSNF